MRILAALLSVLCLALWVGGGAAIAQKAAYRGDPDHGRELAEQHCSRCHVVGDFNRYGGIGSTPSFQLLARRDDWESRFTTFHARRPHSVFTRIEGFEPTYKGVEYVQPFTISLEEVADITAFVREELVPGE